MRRSISGLVLALAVFVGCDDDPKPPPPESASAVPSPSASGGPAASATASAAPPQPSPLVDRVAQLPKTTTPLTAEEAERWIAPQEQVRVELVSGGKAPRRVHRYRGEVGAKGTVVIELRSDSTVEGGEGEVTTPVPPMLVGLELSIRAVSDDRLTLEVAVAEWAIDGKGPDLEVAAALAASLKGTSSRWTITARGATAPPPPPSGIDPAAGQLWASVAGLLLDAMPPVPATGFGKGARWRVLDRVVRGGVPMLRLTSFTARDATDAGWLLEGTVREVPLAVPPAPPSPALKLRVEDAAAVGKRRIALSTTPWPLACATEVAADATIEATPTMADAKPVKAIVHLTELQTLLRADLEPGTNPLGAPSAPPSASAPP